MSSRNTRRDFLKTTAAAGAGFFIANRLQAADSNSPNERIRFACIGIGGKGQSDSDDAARHGDVVAICDVDSKTLDAGAKRFAKSTGYSDFRKLLDEMGSKIDAVTVSTPDHCHAAAAAMAMNLGKHCFCQKPMTRAIWEARRLSEIAKEKKLATQMGNQGTANSTLRRAAAIVQSGVLGTVKEVHVWTDRPIWAQGGSRPPEKPVPAHLNWDAWIGPAPMRPYADGYHPFAWRGYWDFGTGALGDMACHTVNMPFMALNLRNPTSVEAETSGHNKETYPKWSIIKYEFPAQDQRPALTMTWYDGGKRPSKDMLDGENPHKSGALIIGDKGKFYSPGDYAEMPYKLLGGAPLPEVKIEESPGHFEEWVRAIKGGPQARSNFPDYAGPLTETILLGNLAVYAGKKVDWDAKELVAKNAPDVAHIIKPEYRQGYTV
jgi:predicted dehydrogenase